MEAINKKPDYGNWVSTGLIEKFLFIFLLFGAADAILWIFVPGLTAVKIILAVLAAAALASIVYFFRARRHLSESGGRVQDKILELLMAQIDWDGNGKALDIGCGSAALVVKLAKKYGNARITGVDYWGSSWGYSKKLCEENCSIEGVASNTDFIHAGASRLPFGDGIYDLAVSNLTFHEVKDTINKYDIVKEALRVVKKGGRFVFQDLFLLHSYYGDMDKLMEALRRDGIEKVEFIDTSKSSFIPNMLRLPFMVGSIGILHGTK